MRPILKLPTTGPDRRQADGAAAARPAPVPPPDGRRRDSTQRLQQLVSLSLWPIVDAAFQGVDDEIDGRFFQLADLQVVVSRAPVREVIQRQTERTVTLEVWPAAGRRLLVVEWNGRRPNIVYRRDGDWLPRLIRASRQFQQPQWLLAPLPDR